MRKCVILFLVSILFSFAGCIIISGSYADGQWYDSKDVISALLDLKQKHPEYIAWQTRNNERYNPDGKNGYYYSFYYCRHCWYDKNLCFDQLEMMYTE